MVILVSGATGFIGSAVISRLSRSSQVTLRPVVRNGGNHFPAKSHVIVVDDFSNADWSNTLKGVDVVVHLAARAHVLKESASQPLEMFRKINLKGTLNFAQQSVSAGVKRFIFISSIGVNGNQNNIPFSENDAPNPAEPYAVSKYESELGLREIARATDMEVVIIRPPLVYGPNAPGNFGRLLKWVKKGVPLPLSAIYNKRSLIALDNLVDFIVLCIDHRAAANQTFLVSDGKDLSTTELLHGVALAMGKKARLFPVPMGLLNLGATLLGKKALFQRLCGSLQVDISKSRQLLGWNPPITVEEGLRRAVRGDGA